MGRPRHELPASGDRVDGPEAMTAERVEGIVQRHCTSKHRYANPGAARGAARSARDRTGERISSYRCSFAGGTRASAHWHIGHVPSVAALQDIADAIRYRAQHPGALGEHPGGERS
jgi:hypothetical protein